MLRVGASLANDRLDARVKQSMRPVTVATMAYHAADDWLPTLAEDQGVMAEPIPAEDMVRLGRTALYHMNGFLFVNNILIVLP